jgi:hypothetical protein
MATKKTAKKKASKKKAAPKEVSTYTESQLRMKKIHAEMFARLESHGGK